MPAVNSRKPVTYRSHCPTPTLSKCWTIEGTPASLAPPVAMNTSAVMTERIRRMIRRPLPAAAGRSLAVVIRLLLASQDDSVLKAEFVTARRRSRELTDRFRIGDCGIQASSRYLVSVSSPAALAAKNPAALFPENGK